MQGKEVQRHHYGANTTRATIDVGGLANGMYIMEVHSDVVKEYLRFSK